MQAYLAGNQGESLASESVAAVRKIVDSVPAPSGVKAYVTGAGALIADQHSAGQKSLQKVTIITFVVIIVMLLWVYRSIITVFSTLFMVVIEVMAARGLSLSWPTTTSWDCRPSRLIFWCCWPSPLGQTMRSLFSADIKRRAA